MSDFDILLSELHRQSEDGVDRDASSWELLKLFDENECDPDLTRRVVFGTHEFLTRLSAKPGPGWWHDQRMSGAQLNEGDYQRIVDLVRQDPTIVTVSPATSSGLRLPPSHREGKAQNDDRPSARLAAAYLEARPAIAKAFAFTWAQNDLRSGKDLPLFRVGIFMDDFREFLSHLADSNKFTEPFIASQIAREIYRLVA